LLTANPLAWTAQERQLDGKPPYHPEEAEGHNVILKDYAAAVRKIAEEENVPQVCRGNNLSGRSTGAACA
jgi:hypothetical protein